MEETLHKDHYTKKRWFDKEVSNIFHNDWICIGREEEFEGVGDYKLANIMGEHIIIIRGSDDELRGFYNFCKHRGCELFDSSKGELSGTIKNNIRCPYHSWTYDLDGKLKNAPHLNLNMNDTRYHLSAINLRKWGGFVFISLSENEISLKDYLKDIPNQLKRYPLEELRSKVNIEYKIKSNWKVILENYNECYHCSNIHPELCKIVPAFRNKGGSDLDWDNGVPHKEGANTFTLSGTTNREAFPELNKNEKERHFGQALYPNLLISLAMDHVAVFIVNPISPNQTNIDFSILFHPDAINDKEFDPSDAKELWDITNLQDWEICEKVQRGMQSKAFKQGFYAKMEDENLDVKKYVSEKLNIIAN